MKIHVLVLYWHDFMMILQMLMFAMCSKVFKSFHICDTVEILKQTKVIN
jgi:hypothetical protein